MRDPEELAVASSQRVTWRGVSRGDKRDWHLATGNGKTRKGGRAVSWLSRIRSWWVQLLGGGRDHEDPEATEEFATLSSFTLLPGQLKLRVGVVSVRGNYREHNEDNFYVPGRRSVRHDSNSDSQADMATCVIVGSAATRLVERPGTTPLVYTPRGTSRPAA